MTSYRPDKLCPACGLAVTHDDETGQGMLGCPMWSDIRPADAVALQLPFVGPLVTIEGPLNELGERCPWPWEPQQLGGAPMGQYHCSYCGGMNVAGMPHLDWTREEIDEMATAATIKSVVSQEELDDLLGVAVTHVERVPTAGGEPGEFHWVISADKTVRVSSTR